jgi:hypothetical protein
LIVRHRKGLTAVVENILHLPAPAVIAEDHVQLAVAGEPDDAAVVIAARHVVADIVLERSQIDDVAIETQRGPVPDESIDSIAEQRDIDDLRHIRACRRRSGTGRGGDLECGGTVYRRAGPVQVNETVRRELRMQSDAEQPALGRVVY